MGSPDQFSGNQPVNPNPGAGQDPSQSGGYRPPQYGGQPSGPMPVQPPPRQAAPPPAGAPMPPQSRPWQPTGGMPPTSGAQPAQGTQQFPPPMPPGQQQFGGYSPPGQFGGPTGSTPKNKSKRPLILAALGVVVALLVVFVGGFAWPGWFKSNDTGTSAQQQNTSDGSSSASGDASGGTQTVSARDHGAEYDVPGDWTVNAPSDQFNVPRKGGDGSDPSQILGTSGDTAFRETEKSCAGTSSAEDGQSILAAVGMTASNGQTDPQKGAVHAVGTWASGYYRAKDGTEPQVQVDDGKQIQVNNGKNQAWIATGQVTPKPNAESQFDKCKLPPSGVVKVVAVPGGSTGSLLMVLIADQGVPNAVSPDTLDKIAQSMRKTDAPPTSSSPQGSTPPTYTGKEGIAQKAAQQLVTAVNSGNTKAVETAMCQYAPEEPTAIQLAKTHAHLQLGSILADDGSDIIFNATASSGGKSQGYGLGVSNVLNEQGKMVWCALTLNPN